MKKIIFCFAISAAVQVSGQPTTPAAPEPPRPGQALPTIPQDPTGQPPRPGQALPTIPQTTPGQPLRPGQALPTIPEGEAPPFMPAPLDADGSISGMTNVFSPFIPTNGVGQDVLLHQATVSLFNLQASMERAMPLLAMLTAGGQLNEDAVGATAPNAGVSAGVAPSGVDASANHGQNHGQNLSQNLSSRVGAPPAQPPQPGTGVLPPARGVLPPSTPQGVVPPAQVVVPPTPPGVLAPTGPGAPFGPFPGPDGVIELNPETLRLLVILQSDLQRIFPLVSALNATLPLEAGGAEGLSGVGQGGFTNRFVPMTNTFTTPLQGPFAPPLTNPPRILAPTGR
jgi:hypothetical protein